MEEKKTGQPHSLVLEERKAGSLTGIRDVISFDEKEILLKTTQGRLSLKGEQLHVKRLDLEKGEVDIEGRVDQMVYLSKDTGSKEMSLLQRLLR